MIVTFAEARARAMSRELDANPEAVALGYSLIRPVAALAKTIPMYNDLDRRYAAQLVDPPISEFANVAAAVGAAMMGLRMFVSVGTGGFMYHSFPAIVQEAANVRYLTGGKVHAPVIIHARAGARRSGAAQHEQMPQAMLQSIPGLWVYSPGTPAEIDAVIHTAFQSEDPTVILDHEVFDHEMVDSVTGEVGEQPGDPDVPQLVRSGDDVLVVASGLMVQYAMMAVEELAGAASVAVLSQALISPPPTEEMLNVIALYERVVLVDECRGPGSPTSYIMAKMLEAGLRPQVGYVYTRHAPSPFSLTLLDAVIPTVARIREAVTAVINGKP